MHRQFVSVLSPRDASSSRSWATYYADTHIAEHPPSQPASSASRIPSLEVAASVCDLQHSMLLVEPLPFVGERGVARSKRADVRGAIAGESTRRGRSRLREEPLNKLLKSRRSMVHM